MTAPGQSSVPALSAVSGRELAMIIVLGGIALGALLAAARYAPFMPGDAARLDLVFGYLAYAVLLAVVWAVAVRGPKRRWRDIGLRGCDPALLVIGAFAGLIWVGISTAIYSAAGMWEIALAEGGALIEPHRGNTAGLAAFFLLAVPVTAFAEEILYRGIIYGWLRRHLRAALAAPASAILFSFSHIAVFAAGIPFIVEALALSVLLALLFELSRSLWPGILCHALINLALVVAYLLN